MRSEERTQAERLDTAKAAAPYVHPRLTTTTIAGDRKPTQRNGRPSYDGDHQDWRESDKPPPGTGHA
jgi:hypothetical protein